MLTSLLLLALVGAPSDSVGWTASANFEFGLSLRPPLPERQVDLGWVESYSGNWAAHRLDPEMARRWEDLPSLLQGDLRIGFGSFQIFARLPLRRDVDAWQQDPSGSNLPVSTEEVDINIPYLGWASWTGPADISVQAGRFRQSYSPSPYGVILGSDLIHDGLAVRLPMGRWTFDWFFSSLNPWLTGIRADRSVASGSEAQQQTTRTISNQRGRIYDDPEKSLFLHRLACKLGDWELSLVEQILVGGKPPQWREAVPFVVWHNNYGDGYSKVSTAAQVVWNAPSLGRFHLQGIMDDIQSPVGEVDGADPRTVFGANAGWRMRQNPSTTGWSGSIDLTATSATLNNHRIPLLKGTSRRLYRSNNREQSTPGFVDTWIVDQPLAYRRGSDALDFWSHWDWTAADSQHGAGVEIDWLNQGDARVWMDADSLADREGPLSGKVTSEWRFLAHGWHRWFGRLRVDGEGGLVVLRRWDEHKTTMGPAWSAGASWRF